VWDIAGNFWEIVVKSATPVNFRALAPLEDDDGERV
jgi:hypothetical protein